MVRLFPDSGAIQTQAFAELRKEGRWRSRCDLRAGCLFISMSVRWVPEPAFIAMRRSLSPEEVGVNRSCAGGPCFGMWASAHGSLGFCRMVGMGQEPVQRSDRTRSWTRGSDTSSEHFVQRLVRASVDGRGRLSQHRKSRVVGSRVYVCLPDKASEATLPTNHRPDPGQRTPARYPLKSFSHAE